MASLIVKPVYRAFSASLSTPTNPNLYFNLTDDLAGTTIPIGFASFVNDAGVTATQLYDLNASPRLTYDVLIGGVVQQSNLVPAGDYSTSAVTLVFSALSTIYATDLIQLAYSGATIATTVTIQ